MKKNLDLKKGLYLFIIVWEIYLILIGVYLFFRIDDAHSAELARDGKIVVTNRARVSWDIPTEPDVKNWVVHVKGSLGIGTVTADSNHCLVDCSSVVDSTGIERVLFWVTAVDSAGNESAPSDTVDLPMAKKKFLFGDLNADNSCDVLDSAILWRRGLIGAYKGTPDYDGRMDVDANGVIDVFDHIAFIYNIGTKL